jgi:hypothetical protein
MRELSRPGYLSKWARRGGPVALISSSELKRCIRSSASALLQELPAPLPKPDYVGYSACTGISFASHDHNVREP